MCRTWRERSSPLASRTWCRPSDSAKPVSSRRSSRTSSPRRWVLPMVPTRDCLGSSAKGSARSGRRCRSRRRHTVAWPGPCPSAGIAIACDSTRRRSGTRSRAGCPTRASRRRRPGREENVGVDDVAQVDHSLSLMSPIAGRRSGSSWGLVVGVAPAGLGRRPGRRHVRKRRHGRPLRPSRGTRARVALGSSRRGSGSV